MKNIGVFAFGLTSCLLVPAMMHALEAGPNQVAKLVAADEQSVQVGDAKVDISVDRGMVDAGGKVHVTLTATADKRMKLPLAVLVYEQAGMGAGRTESPPVRVGRDEVTLDIVDGKATQTFAFTLPGNRPDTMGGTGMFGHYTILVMPPKAADQLETKRRGASDSGHDPREFFPAYNSPETSGEIARLDVHTRSANDHIAIVAADTARANGDIAVKVRVKNPTRRAFTAVQVSLDTEATELAGWQGIGKGEVVVDDNPGATVALAARETKEVVFHVHTASTGTIGLIATVQCTGDDCYTDDKGQGTAAALDDSVLDAIDVLPALEPAGDGSAGPAVAEGSAAPPAAAPAAPAASPAAPAASPATAAASPTTHASAP